MSQQMGAPSVCLSLFVLSFLCVCFSFKKKKHFDAKRIKMDGFLVIHIPMTNRKTLHMHGLKFLYQNNLAILFSNKFSELFSY